MQVSRLARMCLFALVLLYAEAAAGAELRVVLVSRSSSDPVVARIQGELRVLGILAIVRPPDPDRSLEEIARSESAVAVAVIDEHSVSLLIEPEGKATQSLRITGSEGEAPELLALRTVELLRGALIEVPEEAAAKDGSSGREKERAAKPTTRPPAPAQRERRETDPARPTTPVQPAKPHADVPSFGLLLAPAGVWSPGGFGPASQLRVDASWIPAANWNLGLTFFAPLGGATASVRGGEVRIVLFSPS